MAKQCTQDGCSYPVFSKSLCVNHWRSMYSSGIKQKVPVKTLKYATKAIKKVSTRQQKLNIAYKVLRDQFIKDNPTCQARLEGCTYVSTECHHSHGRCEYFLDATTFKSLCHNCHAYLETHVEVSRALGFTLNRLDKY